MTAHRPSSPEGREIEPVQTLQAVQAQEAVPPVSVERQKPDEAQKSMLRDDKVAGYWGPIVVAVSFLSAIVTFLFLMGVFAFEPKENRILALLALDVVFILALLTIVIRRLLRLRSEKRAGLAGARLHRRVVWLFSLVAAVPTTLVAGAALLVLERGLTPWFSGDLRALVQNAEIISQNFQQQICQNLGREMRLMAADLDRANSSNFFLGNQSGFQAYMTSRATALGFPHAEIFKEDGSMIMKADIAARKYEIPSTNADDLRFAATDEPPCLFSREAIGGVIKLSTFGADAYLMVSRGMDQRALEFPVIARSGVLQYQSLESRRTATQYGIALVFALLTLIGLLGAVLLGLGFADRLVDPVRRLMQATDQVSEGNLYVQVPIAKMGTDLEQLGATFNNMTKVLRDQHDSLHAANAIIDQRRRFTEAVLAGVPAGVIGLDSEGLVTLMNPTARQILLLKDEDFTGHPSGEILPEIAGFLDEARAMPQRLSQSEISVRRRGVERILSIRATGDESGGLVVTLDDISDLIAAQRSSAWADVARRIAHEIKNPLTPIQLSAERIRRKFGKVIIEDKPIFEQCTDTIIRQVDDIKRMVDEFSSFARMPKPQLVDEDLVSVLREVTFMMRVGNPQVQFEEALPDPPVLARMDRRLIAQALQNLIKNACEAILESTAGRAGQGRLWLSLYLEGEELRLDIRDNGKGFPVEDRQRLLEPYVTTREGGTGLGLPIVAKIFEDHGGRIELLDPPEGPGALVRIYLPAAAGTTSVNAADGQKDVSEQR